MLLDTLEDTKVYLKATLIQCLVEANQLPEVAGKVQHTYKTILRREKEGIDQYSGIRRDPATNYRFYTGLQIRKIVDYEINRAKGQSSGSEQTGSTD